MMRGRTAQAMLILMALTLSSCGLAKRVVLAGVLAVQSDAVMTQSSFNGHPISLNKRCGDLRIARLHFANAFASATPKPQPRPVIVTSVRVAAAPVSLKTPCRRA